MAFEKLVPDHEDNGERRTFWKPEMVGENLEGWVTGYADDDFGNKRMELKDTDGDLYWLPAHKGIKKYYNKVRKGDYIKVEVENIDDESYDYPIISYGIYVDPDNFDEGL